ncbi:hypothetical protein D1B31_06540 [Neobacillus notoginsengisoli]|uniref:Protein-L-IsoD(D-D) O-methyltransferase n=1 Tax=Neobacillus notoginsengisoli TaxID=1578198 RepID=A0A417YXH2_9BACI|nr:class I SAM-dependent methyltransferase [Neobacillus notoginsengisoli]RHW42274.1 hypothetical protein D1B31_06540 [Neobacillus notoginsengisoli]
MFVTTAGRVNEKMIDSAKSVSTQLGIPYVPRRKKSIQQLQSEAQSSCIVTGNERFNLFAYGESDPFYFHPSSAMFRVKRLLDGGTDPLIEAADLKDGESFLDCTLGLASDSIVASCVIGESGNVTGIEGNQYVSFIVKNGLKTWDSGLSALDEAMQRVNVIHREAVAFLKTQPDNSWDCVYFDPMFEESIEESEGIKGLRQFALHGGIGAEEFAEAYRVARKRVVLKDHYKSRRFDLYDFKRTIRKTAKFHFGYIEKN